MKDRAGRPLAVRWPLLFGVLIELMVEDRADWSIGEGADLNTRGSSFETCDAEPSR